MKRNDWYTLYLSNGAKVYASLQHDDQGKPNVPFINGTTVSLVEKGFDFKSFYHTGLSSWQLRDRITPVNIADHLPHLVTKDQMYHFVNLYAHGQLGPFNLQLELRGVDEIWTHPRNLGEFWNRALTWERKRLLKLAKQQKKLIASTMAQEPTHLPAEMI